MFYLRYITFLFALAGYIQRRIHRRLHDAIQGLADEVPRNAQNPWVLHIYILIYLLYICIHMRVCVDIYICYEYMY